MYGYRPFLEARSDELQSTSRFRLILPSSSTGVFRSHRPTDRPLRYMLPRNRAWQTYSTEAKRDFVEAYSVKADLSDDDFEILRYLMKEGSDETWRWIAVRLTELPEKDDIRTFLLARIEAAGSSFPDYIQALELLGDSKAAGVIARKFETYR